MWKSKFPFWSGVLALSTSLSVAASNAAEIDYATQVKPLLAKHCGECHGPKKSEAELRLDVRSKAFGKGESGHQVIKPGDGAGSELIARITSADASTRMPPEKDPLSADEIAILKQWIDGGAKWPDELAGETLANAKEHWAFKTPVRPEVPAVSDAAWSQTAIDRFILARLDKEGMTPSPLADKPTLLRRLSLDLTGLPPTPQEIDAFLDDKSDDAYAKQVERLLKSPHYGERWGRHWLDAARYADSDGYEKDKSRAVYFYRDWVVSALNRDLPYDQFIIEQLAGDLLPDATQDQLVATGFLRNSMINEEGGIDPEQFRMEAMFDRMDAIGKSVLGLTLACCQCHNHKYDPFSQEDYYRIFAYFNDTHEASTPVYTAAQLMQRAEIFRKIGEIENGLRETTPDWADRMGQWESAVTRNTVPWKVVKVANEGENAQRYVYHEDGSQMAWGYAPTKWESAFKGESDLPVITAFQIDLLNDVNLPLNGPGRSPKGLFALTEFKVEAINKENPSERVQVKFSLATADFGNERRPLEAMYHDKSDKERVTGPVTYAIDGDDLTAWGVDAGPGRSNIPRRAVFVAERPIQFPKGATLIFRLRQMHGGWNSDDNQNNNLGRFRFSVTDVPSAVADQVPANVQTMLAIPREKRTEAQQKAIFSYWLTTVPQWSEQAKQIEELWKTHPPAESQLTMAAREKSRDTFVLKRGDFLKPGKNVSMGVPAALHELQATPEQNRLTFARWAVHRRSPTAARAMVNRIWQAYFGTGFVSSSEDLGRQCEAPSHPELFDWLAVEFMEKGWSLKQLHRTIVNTATYKQSSKVSDEALVRDPYNRLLARGSRLRVEAEVVRDIALAASGLLNPEVGGPPVFPPAPAFLFQPPVSYGPKVWNEETGANRYRRGIYTFRFRSVPYPVFTNFDTPNGDASCVKRPRSNTPLQALTSLNEPLFLECARALAMKALNEGGADDGEKIAYAFRRCTGRLPSERERLVLLGLLKNQTEKFAQPDAKPWELAANDPANPPALPNGASPAQAAGWTAVARVMLNLDETITKE